MPCGLQCADNDLTPLDIYAPYMTYLPALNSVVSGTVAQLFSSGCPVCRGMHPHVPVCRTLSSGVMHVG